MTEQTSGKGCSNERLTTKSRRRFRFAAHQEWPPNVNRTKAVCFYGIPLQVWQHRARFYGLIGHGCCIGIYSAHGVRRRA
jgi:hypothetical protein